MVRLTITISDELHEQLRSKAFKEKTSISKLIVEKFGVVAQSGQSASLSRNKSGVRISSTPPKENPHIDKNKSWGYTP